MNQNSQRLGQQAQEFLQRLESQAAIWVRVDAVEGSAPREIGAWMAVFHDHVIGTVGGGHVEYQAIEQARQRLYGATGQPIERFALGPALGQCCGGVMHLRFDGLSAYDISATQAWLVSRQQQWHQAVGLFGAGHVGRALVHILGALPFSVTWLDSRSDIFPATVPDNVTCEHSDPLHRAVRDLPAGSRVLIMSFSHAEDLDVVAACLARQRRQADLPYIGLIGSQTKWASFRQRLLERGYTQDELDHVTSPIGVPGIVSKEPQFIAVAVAAQVLQVPS